MNITYRHIENNTLQLNTKKAPAAETFEENSWVNINSNDRQAVADFLEKHTLTKECRDYIEHPESYSLGQSFGKTMILNIVMSAADNIYEANYIIVIVANKTLVTIVPESSSLFKKEMTTTYPEMQFSDILNHIYYLLTADLLVLSNINMGVGRGRIHQTQEMLVNQPDNLTSADIMKLERDISQLADIIEDQYVGFGILGSLFSDNSSKNSVVKRKEIEKGFDPLDKSMSRLEGKAESLRLQYMLIQQEKSTRKINFLTIVQAIFVPLTFLAGIYGMNFTNIPELNWEYGYYGYWLIMILIAAGLLGYFHKHGWFK
jgi:magnesium transporter